MNIDHRGFTIVELLIVVVVIAILASITIVSYNGIQNSAKNTQVMNDIRQVSKLIEAHKATTGAYPSTGGLSRVYADNNCTLLTDSDGYKGVDWVPGLTGPSGLVASLPQNPGLVGASSAGGDGCYIYASDGDSYVLSAWNAKRGNPDTGAMYRRLGWREVGFFASNNYYCNHPAIGGVSSGVYSISGDYYKRSYTVSNIANCSETPPSGA